MKKLFAALLLAVLCATLCGCSLREDAMVNKAVKVLKEAYTETYENMADSPQLQRYDRTMDGYLEIYDTRVIYVKDRFQLEGERNQSEAEGILGDVYCVIEFSVCSDIGTAPYYPNTGRYTSVIVYKDGRMEAGWSPYMDYMYNRYKYGLADTIESISNLGDDFNGKWKLLK